MALLGIREGEQVAPTLRAPRCAGRLSKRRAKRVASDTSSAFGGPGADRTSRCTTLSPFRRGYRSLKAPARAADSVVRAPLPQRLLQDVQAVGRLPCAACARTRTPPGA